MMLLDIHKKGKSSWNDNWETCQCSYCKGKNKLHYGLNIPKQWKKPNSWWVIKVWKDTYIRWTNSWIRKIKPISK